MLGSCCLRHHQFCNWNLDKCLAKAESSSLSWSYVSTAGLKGVKIIEGLSLVCKMSICDWLQAESQLLEYEGAGFTQSHFRLEPHSTTLLYLMAIAQSSQPSRVVIPCAPGSSELGDADYNLSPTPSPLISSLQLPPLGLDYAGQSHLLVCFN